MHTVGSCSSKCLVSLCDINYKCIYLIWIYIYNLQEQNITATLDGTNQRKILFDDWLPRLMWIGSWIDLVTEEREERLKDRRVRVSVSRSSSEWNQEIHGGLKDTLEGGTHVPGEVLLAAVVTSLLIHGDKVIVGVGLLECQQHVWWHCLPVPVEIRPGRPRADSASGWLVTPFHHSIEIPKWKGWWETHESFLKKRRPWWDCSPADSDRWMGNGDAR
jgi:hypothetical protein